MDIKVKRKSFQWQPWAECKNRCDFCCLGKTIFDTPDSFKIKNLENLLNTINTLDLNQYNNISMIGGDFFQGEMKNPEVASAFLKVVDKIAELLSQKKIDSCWITCTLTMGGQEYLYELLDIFEKKKKKAYPDPSDSSSGLWLCTSWDSKGRFHTPVAEKNWEYHMRNIKEKYPWVKFNTTIILQQDLLEKYLRDEINFTEFQEEFNTSLFFKPCYFPLDLINDFDSGKILATPQATLKRELRKRSILKEEVAKRLGYQFYPDRNTFLRFLQKVNLIEPQYIHKMCNVEYRADEYHGFTTSEEGAVYTRVKDTYEGGNEQETMKDNGSVHTEEKILNKCGHLLDYAAYNDCDECIICDKRIIEEI